jgi:hypothetical protein
MKDWYASHPHLFIKQPYDHSGKYIQYLFRKNNARKGSYLAAFKTA